MCEKILEVLFRNQSNFNKLWSRSRFFHQYINIWVLLGRFSTKTFCSWFKCECDRICYYSVTVAILLQLPFCSSYCSASFLWCASHKLLPGSWSGIIFNASLLQTTQFTCLNTDKPCFVRSLEIEILIFKVKVSPYRQKRSRPKVTKFLTSYYNFDWLKISDPLFSIVIISDWLNFQPK